jgi:hypothetical protein
MAESRTLNYRIQVQILPVKVERTLSYNLGVIVSPAKVSIQEQDLNYPFEFILSKIPVNISDPIKSTAFDFLADILETYVDEDRELKTLLNFGEDRQNVIISQRTASVNATGVPTMQFKLLQPVENDIDINEPLFISTEVANTIIQSARIKFAPPIDRTPYLRPRNMDAKVTEELGKSLRNVTLNVLKLQTGSLGTITNMDGKSGVSFEDDIFRRWYSYDFNSSELNIDFTNYDNFVFYGSAAMRLQAFRQKLLEIERLTSSSLQFEGGVFTGELASAGATYILDQSSKLSTEKENIIRSFDRYEQHLYFTPNGTVSPYSASAWYAEGGKEYNEISYWPKTPTGTLYPVDSEIAQNWFSTQIEIAQRFDEFNENNLINTVPTHIRDDDENAPYFTFVAMIGHFFDTIKPYVDQFPLIHSRNIDPNDELSKDLVADIAESVGFKVPTIDSVFNLAESVLGTSDSLPRRDFTVETYKRLLHNVPMFAKSKGTRAALRMALRTLGVTEQLIDVQESGESNEEAIRVTGEFYNSVRFVGSSSHIKLPLGEANRTPFPRSIQLNLTIDQNKNMTVLNGDNSWKLDVAVHPTNNKLIRFELVSGTNNTLLTTRYFPNTTSDLINVSIRTYQGTTSTILRVIKVEQEDIIFDLSVEDVGQFITLWNNTDYIYIGGSGQSPFLTDNFVGKVDDIRLWGINLTDGNILNSAFDPGSNAGNIFTDVSNNLYVQLSLNKVDFNLLEVSGSLLNESPYKDKLLLPSLQFIETEGITSESLFRDTRYVRQKIPNTGATTYITNKVKVAPPPIFAENEELQGVKRLYRTESIVLLEDKETPLNINKVNISSSPTTLINQNIIRNIGLENINALYGIPNDSYKTLPNNLFNLRDHYNKFYYMNVDTNRFIRTISRISSVVNQIVDYFIPSRATVLSGITIEPNLLERTKLPKLAKIKLYGNGSRRTINATNTDSPLQRDYAATFTLFKDINLTSGIFTGSFITKDAFIDSSREVELVANSSAVDSVTANKISTLSALSANFDEINKNLVATTGYFKSNIDVSGQEIAGSITPLTSKIKDKVQELLADTLLLSGSIFKINEDILSDTLPLSSSIEINKDIIRSKFKLIDKQHLPRIISSIIKSSKDPRDPNHINSKNLVRRFPTKFLEKSQRIDVGLAGMDKFEFSLGTGLGSKNAEPYNKLYTRKLFEYEILRPRNGGITSLTRRGLYPIPPSCDLDEFGSRNFFIQDFGVYYFDKTTRRPVYSNPLNATWDIQNEIFDGATTWSFGETYTENDVVFQDVQIGADYAETLGEQLVKSSLVGNGRFYVFKGKPIILSENYEPFQRELGEAYYTDRIPSTLPPSLDKENWVKLRFSPTTIPDPRRVVFDTFTIPDPKLNDFKTTTVDVSRRIDLPERFLDIFSLGSIPAGQRRLGDIQVQNIATLFATQINSISTSDANIRLRLYRTLDARDTDLSRDINILPESDDGVLLDITFNKFGQIETINPSIVLISGDESFNGKIYYTVDNLGEAVAGRVELYLYYFSVQVEPRLPRGYLRKHYRFFRDNSTALKRRNFIGCKNTENTTIDGASPVEIFLSEGNESVVDPTIENNEVKYGGGGTLS